MPEQEPVTETMNSGKSATNYYQASIHMPCLVVCVPCNSCVGNVDAVYEFK